MGRRRTDNIDLACREWAKSLRKAMGLDDCRTAREYLGAVKCTLGQRRDLHAGSRSEGRFDPHWPEVYDTEQALLVARAFHHAREELREVLAVHYIARAPAEFKAEALHVSPRAYWNRVAIAKAEGKNVEA